MKKTFYPIQVIGRRFQIDYTKPKKIRHFENYETAPEFTTMYVILIKHKEIKITSDANKTIGTENI